MAEIYRKRGSVIRYENGLLVRVREAGEAVEEDGRFRCAPSVGAALLPDLPTEAVAAAADSIRAGAGESSIERVLIIDGIAEHEFGGRRWEERIRRIHVALVSSSLRVLIDQATFDCEDIVAIAASLARAGRPRPAPPRVRLAPRVAAALIGNLGPRLSSPPLPVNCRIEQRPGGLDGKGLDIAAASGPHWPNWYRPSYRVRPQRQPMNVALRCNTGPIDGSLPRAIALLAPPDGATLHVLCEHGDEVFPTRLRVTGIDAVAHEVWWHPVGAGVWTGEVEAMCG
jgi:hypothetical protein